MNKNRSSGSELGREIQELVEHPLPPYVMITYVCNY